jgi:hypothetical protein
MNIRSGRLGQVMMEGRKKFGIFSLPGERLVLVRVDAFCVVFDIPVLFSPSR